MKKCYVIMPYGGDNEERRRHYMGVYNTIIAPAAIQSGYEPVRSDIVGEHGSIHGDIVKNLINADIVVADLSEGNANVMYELGIRHVLRKSGTVTIVDRTYPLPFDIAPYRAITYSTTDFTSIAATTAQIVEAIKGREAQENLSDNPVHDFWRDLPVDLRQTSADVLSQQASELRKQLEDLHAKNQQLEVRLRQFVPEGSLDGGAAQTNVQDILRGAREASQYSGSNVLVQLAQAREQGESVFVDTLEKLLGAPSLSLYLQEFFQIARMCDSLGLKQYQLATLEIAYSYFPENLQMLSNLADAYENQPNPAVRARGRQMIERALTVEHSESGPVISGRPMGREIMGAAGVLFNFYHSDNRYDWVVSLARSLEEKFGPRAVFIRNSGRGLHLQGLHKEAEAEFQRAIHNDPTDDQTYVFYADLVDDMGRYEEAYEMFEQAFCIDPEDGRYLINLADHIALRKVARGADCAFRQLRINEVPSVIVPFYLRAIEVRPNLKDRVMRMLLQRELLREVAALQADQIPDFDYNYDALRCLEAKLP